MGINEKITYLQETKELIRDAIEEKGVEVADTDSFRSYADKIKSIPQEGGDPYYEDLYNLRTSNGTNMAGLFSRTTADSLDLSRLDTSKVTNMSYMFDNSNIKNLNMNNWNTSKVTDMSYMFNFSKINMDISTLDVANVKNLNNMFSYANLDGISSLKELNILNATLMNSMFANSSYKLGTLDLSNWNTSKVTSMSSLFTSFAASGLDLTGWNTSNVTNMSTAFAFSYSTNAMQRLIIPDWDMTKTTNYSSLFGYSADYTKKLKYIDLSRSNDTTISKITERLYARTVDDYGEIIIPVDSSQKVIDGLIAKYWKPVGPDMGQTTNIEIGFDLDELIVGQNYQINLISVEPWYSLDLNNIEFISSDNTIASIDGNVLNGLMVGTVDVYARLKNDHSVISNTITLQVSETDSYPNRISFRSNGTASSSYVKINGENVYLNKMNYDSVKKLYSYDSSETITSLEFGKSNITELIKLNTCNMNTMRSMFSGCNLLKSINSSNWDTSNVTDMYSIFDGCSSLTSLNLSNWDTSNVTSMQYTFNSCSSLKTLDLSNWDTSKVTNMFYMFANCDSLISLDLTSFNTYSVQSSGGMFANTVTRDITVTDSKWNLTEISCSFAGTFIRV